MKYVDKVVDERVYDSSIFAKTFGTPQYFICRRHKTNKVYGDIIKYLTPGLLKCLEAYSKLPRPDGCNA